MEQYLSVSGNEILDVIKDFAKSVEGLEIKASKELCILQKDDKKTLSLAMHEVEEVLVRKDKDQKVFLQLNLKNSRKLLLTNMWIGFKPLIKEDVIDKIPNVVTTPDIISVFEALEESKRLGLLDEAETLKKVYMAIVAGGELVGFNMIEEKEWLQRLGLSTSLSA